MVFDNLYHYRAIVRSKYDGDTIRVDIDHGMGYWNKGPDGKGVQLRLYGMDAPELRGESRQKGLEALKFLDSLVKVGDEIIIKTFKDEEDLYGRYLAVLRAIDATEDDLSINEQMVKAGHAVEKYYGNRKS